MTTRMPCRDCGAHHPIVDEHGYIISYNPRPLPMPHRCQDGTLVDRAGCKLRPWIDLGGES